MLPILIFLLILIFIVLITILVALSKKSTLSSEIETFQRNQQNETAILRQEMMKSLMVFNDSIRSAMNEKLETVRQTVDEKLQTTLEKRLGESFSLVSERLEKVHQGLGEMQNLATGVGDLKRVLTNVKIRGGWGEIQLGSLLEQMLAPDQYQRNVKIKDGSDELVEYVVCLPDGVIPIDSKFPIEDYERLVDASEKGNSEMVEKAGEELEKKIKLEAKRICEKYIFVPKTTDFAIMFLPTEGLYAEVMRRPGLSSFVQKKYKITITGPSTLGAFLNSLQMGFRTLAIQKRSGEVWQALALARTEFEKYAQWVEKVKKNIDAAGKILDEAGTRTRAIERRLRDTAELSQTMNSVLPEIKS